MNKKRPDWDEYFIGITKEVAKRSTCMSTKIGAIIVKDKRIISTGYSGAPRKTMDCYDRGECLRRKLNIPSGHRYELCRSVHAEQNVIINAARAGVNIMDSDMYIYGVKVWQNQNKVVKAYPCFICKKMIINAGIKNVIFLNEKGEIQKENATDWAEKWQKKDMLDDMQMYNVEYYKK